MAPPRTPAHQKAEHLNCALDDVKTELQVASLSDYQISQRLQEESSAVHQGKTLRLSFWSIAAQKRNSDAFDLAAIDDAPNVPTTTVKHLTAAPFAQWFKEPKKADNSANNILLLDRAL